MKSFDGMPTVRTPEASRTLARAHPGILPSPLRNWVGNFNHVRFRGYLSVHFRFGLPSPCLRFAVDVTAHHARLGTWLLARLCQGNHFRLLNFMRLQGATPTGPDVPDSGIRLLGLWRRCTTVNTVHNTRLRERIARRETDKLFPRHAPTPRAAMQRCTSSRPPMRWRLVQLLATEMAVYSDADAALGARGP